MYVYVGNDPVNASDPTGLKISIIGEDEDNPENSTDFAKRTRAAINKLKSKPFGAALVENLENSENTITIGPIDNDDNRTRPKNRDNASNNVGTGSTIFFDPYSAASDGAPSFVVLAHELGHANENDDGRSLSEQEKRDTRHLVPRPKFEEHAVAVENQVRNEHGINAKRCYNQWHPDC